MRKINVIIILLLFYGGTICAQVGIKIGFIINQMRIDDVREDSLQHPITFQAGGLFTWNVSDKFSLQPELYYSRSGAKRTISLQDQSIVISEYYSYLRLPLLAKLSFLSNGTWKLSPFGGFYGAYNLSAEQEVSHAGEKYSDSIRQLINPVDFGWIAGLEIGRRTGKGHLTLDFRFSYGLMNTNKREYSTQKIYNRMIVLLLGYRFGK